MYINVCLNIHIHVCVRERVFRCMLCVGVCFGVGAWVGVSVGVGVCVRVRSCV